MPKKKIALPTTPMSQEERNTQTFNQDFADKERLKQLVTKFPTYPCIAERHPEKIEKFLEAYTLALNELKQAVA